MNFEVEKSFSGIHFSLVPIPTGLLESQMHCIKTWTLLWDGSFRIIILCQYESSGLLQVGFDTCGNCNFIINICFHGSSLYMAGEACGQEWTGTVFGAQER